VPGTPGGTPPPGHPPFPPAGPLPFGAGPFDQASAPPAGVAPFGRPDHPAAGGDTWGGLPPTREDPVEARPSPRRRAALIGAAATVFVVLAGVVGATALFSGGDPAGGDTPTTLTGKSVAAGTSEPEGGDGTGQLQVEPSSGVARSAAPSAGGPSSTPGRSPAPTTGGEPTVTSSGRPSSAPTTSQPAKPNPYTPVEACGSGYKVIDSASLTASGVRKGRVYLLYHAGTGTNCVVTMKESAVGTPTSASAWLEVQGRARSTDSGSFSYYAGPVRAKAAGVCVRWGGSTGGASYGSGFEHCG
ncbi:hypothetical protein AB0L34_25360, partial [Micromonospora sp. NPDC052213]|uniref:hypothetical protein n=1 Tax=Micromonospora sp. NPDC052213 TaxID=3155812 RepID=UPI00341E2ACB